jgi:sec-independent protein translocase protein TatA
MPNIGTPELILIFGVVFLLFGVGRISKVGGEMGQAVRAFREGMASKDEAPQEADKKPEAQS